jgi:hypothetical protein
LIEDSRGRARVGGRIKGLLRWMNIQICLYRDFLTDRIKEFSSWGDFPLTFHESFQWQEKYADAGETCRRIMRRLTNSQKVYISQKKGVCVFYDLNQDESINLQFMI